MDKKIRAEFFSRRFSGMQHTIWGRNGKKLEDDLFVDVDPINYEVWNGVIRAIFEIVTKTLKFISFTHKIYIFKKV